MNFVAQQMHLGRFTVPGCHPSLHLWRTDLLRHSRALLETAGQLGVLACAGQGKTQYAAQLCRSQSEGGPASPAVIWLGCEKEDGTAAVLAADLLAAAQRVLPAGALDRAEALSSRMELDLRGWAPFAQSFFGALLEHLPGRILLVLDDIHHLDEAPARELLLHLLRQRPAEVMVLWLARHMGDGLGEVLGLERFPIVSEERLALSIDDIMMLYDAVYQKPLSLAEAVVLHRVTQGWTLGVVLSRFQKMEGLGPWPVGDGLILQGLRRFFHDECLGRLPKARRDFLLGLSLLDYLPRPLVLALAPDAESERELDRLAAGGFFVRREEDGTGEYLLHQLFKNALAEEARAVLPISAQRDVFRRAADWHESQGAWIAALGCLAQSQDYLAVDAFMQRNFALLLGLQEEGRIAEILDRLPASERREHAWLALARGLYPAATAGLDETARWLLRAERLFIRDGSQLGELRALLQMVRRRLFGDMGYDAPEVLLERIRALRRSCREQQEAVDHLLAALVEGQFGILQAFDYGQVQDAARPLLESGLPERLVDIKAELVAILGHAECMLGYHGRGLDALEQGLALLGRANISSWARFYLRMAHANTLGLLGCWPAFEHDRTALMREPEALLNQTLAGPFLKIWDITRLTVAGDGACAAEMARTMLRDAGVAANPVLRGQFQQYLGYALALAGRHGEALHMAAAARESQSRAPNAFFELVNLLTVGATLVLCDRHDEGVVLLDRVLEQQTVAGERGLFEGALWLKALSCHRRGQDQAALDLLGEALRLNRERGGYHFIWSVLWLRELLALAVRRGVEAKQAQAVARRVCNGSLLKKGALVPYLDIHVLGPFAVTTGAGRRLELADFTPIQRRLLGLLALRSEQGAAVADIMNALWPGVHSESARASLDTALLRLRKLLADGLPPARAPYLVMRNGILRLRHVRIDGWRFLDLCRRAEEHLGRQRPWQAEACYCEAFQWLRGRFSGHDLDGPEAAPLGRRLDKAIGRAALSWERLLKMQGRDADALAMLHAAHGAAPADGPLTRRLHDLQACPSAGPEGRVRAARVLDAYCQALTEQGLPAETARQSALRLFDD